MPDSPDELIERVAAELRRPVRLDPALDRRIMDEVRAHPRRHSPWLLRPRVMRMTPLGALARAAVIAAIAMGATFWVARLRRAPAAASPARVVAFVLYAPTAQSVTLAGDFNDWDTAATPLKPSSSAGSWVVTVPLPPGRYRYAFVVNGTDWRPDPGAPPAPDDDFGTKSSVVMVGSS